ncbi:HAD family hydrolase [Butyricicoccus faecihominis]|uniref:HAD family hydrolase n=1 Tax=Butyricicoccaceae TaxID=3085642 RepID=UPI002478C0E1|nr:MULTISPECIES: HAD family hydrolase [Butyricicoccaceae]MCQ5128665.1 HAD family hydrolase [Butyricicoccus faecihominis]WNX85821.1 HAD family hydrolase [Agathobaculum sp. NTUH-O15-33]
MGLKAVFFDLDDTLYASFMAGDAYAYEQLARFAEETLGVNGQEFVAAFAAARKKLARMQPGMPPLHDRVLAAQGALESMGLNAVRYARAVFSVYWNAVFDKMERRPGVPELLRDLRAAGVKTAVCTDMLADIQLDKLDRLGLADLIDFLVSSEEAGRDKPAPPIFQLALQKCGCLPEEAVMVGDNFLHDVQGAYDCGIPGVWLNWTGLDRPENACPHTEAADFIEAARYIRTLL